MRRLPLLETIPYQLLQTAINPSIEPHFVSGYLGDVLDPTTLSKVSYWQDVSSRYVNAPKAWETMMQLCDFTVGIGSGNEFKSYFGAHGVCLASGEDFSNVLGQLYEKGCSLNWHAVVEEGLRTHLPYYYWT